MKHLKTTQKNLISIVLFVLTLLMNFLGARGVINGASQSDVSQMFPTLITPAGFTFSIWGVIYSLIFIALVWGSIHYKKEYYQQTTDKISVVFWISCLLNIAWIVAFSYQIIWLSAILIVALCSSVVLLIKKLAHTHGNTKSLFDLGFGIYGGWLTIASLVNFFAFLVSIDFQFFGQELCLYTILLALFLVFVVYLQSIHKNPFFNLAIIWAFFGISVEECVRIKK